jgi:hypothetical protein
MTVAVIENVFIVQPPRSVRTIAFCDATGNPSTRRTGLPDAT